MDIYIFHIPIEIKLTAIAPNNNPITRVTTKEPLTPNILLILSANLKMR